MPNRIKELRESRGITQPALAERVGTSQPQMDRLEKGQRRLTQDWLERISQALGCNPAELLLSPSGKKADGLDARQKRILFEGIKAGLRKAGLDPDDPDVNRRALAAFDEAQADILAQISTPG